MSRRTGGGGFPISRRRRGITTPFGARDELEAPLQAFVRRECKARDLLHYHTHRSERSERGFPDSVIVGPRGVVFRELKSDGGRAEPEQLVWLHRLREAGADAAIWTPQDRRSGRILNELNWLSRDRQALTNTLPADLAKTLYLFSRADDEPAAAVHWDAGSPHVDHDRWRLHAQSTIRMLLATLPHTPEQVSRWLREHQLTSPEARQVFAAVHEDLARSAAGLP
ncbi:hypothetical protein [Actinoplanes sp. NPDC026623]|uniref:hypothetical protein n=1 Tax=Actinoplanes sp. NPDC026623 TaxID=3155610 RepID=UPI0033FBCFB5